MSKDDAYWLRLAYVIFTVLVALTAYKALGTLGVQTGWADRFDEYYQPASTFAGIIIGVVFTWLLVRNKERGDYFLAAIGELRKVTWPSLPDTRRMTLIVCVVVGIFAVILAVFDFVWAKIFGLLLS
jgi:preprotein translocase subunit SecE